MTSRQALIVLSAFLAGIGLGLALIDLWSPAGLVWGLAMACALNLND